MTVDVGVVVTVVPVTLPGVMPGNDLGQRASFAFACAMRRTDLGVKRARDTGLDMEST